MKEDKLDSGFRTVNVTTKDKAEAIFIAKNLLNKKMIACANIIPQIESTYMMNGKFINNNESLLILKTTEQNVSKIIKEIKKIHSYEIPAIESIPISDGNYDYLSWIQKVTK